MKWCSCWRISSVSKYFHTAFKMSWERIFTVQKRCLHFIFPLLFACYTLIDPVYSDKDEFYCNKCLDPDGNSCNDVIRRVANSKFWIMKGEKKGSFREAQDVCQNLGFDIAEINSEAEQQLFGKLATAGDRYWIGFVRQQGDNAWTKTDGSPLQWQAGAIEDDINIDDGGMRAISVDAPGVWYSTSVDDTSLIVCQFSTQSPCFRGSGQMPEPHVVARGFSLGVQCPEPTFGDNQLLRTGPSSKFLYPKHLYFTTATKAAAVCNDAGLEPATIDGKADFKHLIEFAFDMRFNNTRRGYKMNIGAINKGFGVYTHPHRTAPKNKLRYQAFRLLDGIYFREDGNCLALELKRSSYFYSPIACDKTSEVMPLCQYKPDKECNKDTPLTLDDEDLKAEKLVQVGQTETNIYYGSLKQKSWFEAEQACEANNLKLLNFPKGKSLEIREILHLVDRYRTDTIGSNIWDGYAWTSGRYRHEQEVIFDISGEPWNTNEHQNDIKWNDLLTIDKLKEACLVVTANGLRGVSCETPNYFICYGPRNTPETTTEPIIEPEVEGRANENSTNSCRLGIMNITFDPKGLSTDEVVGLILSSVAKNFSTGLTDKIDVNKTVKWRIPHLQRMGDITKRLCPGEYVQPSFIHYIQNYMMIYYNSLEEQNRTEDRTKFWDNMIAYNYKRCYNNATRLNLTTAGGLITGFAGDGLTGNIMVANEKADKFPVLDYMLEGLWYMFQMTAAVCYKTSFNEDLIWFAKYFYMFRKDFTSMLQNWWVNPGNTNYGLLFGDMDLTESLSNLRTCAVAAFQRADIADLLLVRPVDIEKDRGYFQEALNERVEE